MQPAPAHPDEARRLRALHALEVLDSPHEQVFDALVKAAALACNVPISLVSLVDAHRQWFKAQTGLPGVDETPRDGAFCAHTILGDGIFEVPDASVDPRFADHPLVWCAPDIRFYAGATLRLHGGAHIGTLCVIDRIPRQLTPPQRELLSHLASVAVEALETRHQARRLLHSAARFRARQGNDGMPNGPVGWADDATDRLHNLRALSDERTRLAALIDGTGAGTWEWNVQTGEVQVNPRWAEIIGWTLQDLGPLTNQFRVDIAHPDELADTRARLREHFAGRSPAYVADVRLRHRDGHWVWVHDRGRLVSRTAEGKPEWVFGTHVDITLRKQQEEDMIRQQHLLDRTGRLARVGGWELDVASGQLRWSDAVRSMHGVAPGCQPDLSTALHFYAPQARPVITAALDAALKLGTPWDLELPMLRVDGTPFWAHSVGEVDVEGDKPARVFVAVQDISERHLIAAVLAHKTEELKRSNEELERFAYITSHDLQEPLRMVTLYGQLLTRRHLADLNPEAKEFVAYMVDGGQRAQALIRDLLSLARLDSQPRLWTPVPLDALLAEVLRPLQLRVQETEAQVTHDPLPTVVGDAAQLGQLMANLLGNALKFRGPAPPRVHVGAVRAGSGWRISVHDNGVGIEPRYFDRIFQMFQRLHLRTEYDGTGIGLALCKKVVERHGGQIGVQSTPGQGATFFFTLPDHAQGKVQAELHGSASGADALHNLRHAGPYAPLPAP